MSKNNNPIKYSDLVQSDSSITDAISALEKLEIQFKKTYDNIIKEAKELKEALNNNTNATEEQQNATRKAVSDAERLSKAQKQLNFSMSDTAKQIAVLKVKQAEYNNENKLVAQINKSAKGSYNRLSAEYSRNRVLINRMTDAEIEGSKAKQKFIAKTKEMREQMDKSQKSTGNSTLSVAKYEDGIRNALGINSEFGNSLLDLSSSGEGLKGSLTQMGTGIKAFGATLWTLMANPVFITMFGIAGAGMVFKFWFDYNKGLIESTRLTKQFTDLSGIELVKLRSEIQATADMFNKDYKDVLTAVNAVAKEMGTTHSQAMESISKGFIAGADSAGDFTQQLKAYSTFARRAGLDTDELIGLIVKFNRAGIYDDKGIDAIKEATISLSEMTPIAEKALEGIGMSGTKLQKELKSGSKTVFEVIQDIAKKTSAFSENSTEYATVIADVFKSAGEDAGGAAIEILAAGDNVKIVLTEIEKIRKELLSVNEEIARYKSDLFESEFFEARTTDALISVKKLWADILGLMASNAKESDLARQAQRDLVHLPIHERIEQQDAYIEKLKEERRIKTEIYEADQFDIDITGALINKVSVKDVETEINKLQLEYDTLNNSSLNGFFLNDMQKKEIDDRIEYLKTLIPKIEEVNKLVNSSLTPEEQKEIEDAQKKALKIADTRRVKAISLNRKYQDEVLKLEKDEFIKREKQVKYTYDRQIEDLQRQLLTDKNLNKEGKESINGVIITLEKQKSKELAKIDQDQQLQQLDIQRQGIALRLEGLKEGSKDELKLRKELLSKELEIALLQNSLKPKSQQLDPTDINNKFNIKGKDLDAGISPAIQSAMSEFDALQDLAQSEFDLLKRTEAEKAAFSLNAEKIRLLKIIELNKSMGGNLTDVQIETMQNTIKGIDQEMAKAEDDGKSHNIYDLLGLSSKDGKYEQAMDEVTRDALSHISEILDANVQLADAQISKTDERVERAEEALIREQEAQRQGYDHNIELAQKELNNAQKEQEEAFKIKEDAVKRQQALDTAMQTTSLITATANLWKSLSGVPFIGAALAIAATATMWGSFAMSKVKAKEVTQSQEYGEGGMEFLEGGSHASGNDISIGTTKSGKHRKAEGGEALIVINRRNTSKYKEQLPRIVESLNKGVFEDRFSRVFSSIGLNVQHTNNPNINLGRLERGISTLVKQGERNTYTDSQGRRVIQYKNRKRIITCN